MIHYIGRKYQCEHQQDSNEYHGTAHCTVSYIESTGVFIFLGVNLCVHPVIHIFVVLSAHFLFQNVEEGHHLMMEAMSGHYDRAIRGDQDQAR
jgi:hypothetical protein